MAAWLVDSLLLVNLLFTEYVQRGHLQVSDNPSKITGQGWWFKGYKRSWEQHTVKRGLFMGVTSVAKTRVGLEVCDLKLARIRVDRKWLRAILGLAL